ncbi:uncharacterized protein PGTG_15985 [Puccinia graminis f. sp. tritici CRL 75-36-700-3]|uniref:Uncharacterized protein n=1 Tax=Puccinia graminis f. sp. tritici (strain CRL 75-36-700-3 / race SCCL) TaxID=418459 RepID=E3L0T3_PUCGT|nr:uncharacterized protein PGTG_15985 [Puccinia graminis f. sp. tritici CRL 75-36-700-3]EFP90137.1 hypothetical protein PGTG_15985 [Puccinia graminis f. sp. tritici CRL 75-36-700-3]
MGCFPGSQYFLYSRIPLRPHYQSAGLTTALCLFITNTQSSSLRIAAKYQKESSSRQRCTLMSWDVFNEPSRPLTNYHVKPVEVDIESGQIWPYIPHSSQIRIYNGVPQPQLSALAKHAGL